MSVRYALLLSYKGTRYCGWQKQNNALTVQQVLEEKISLLQQENVELTGCGRTDTGVHARNYKAHFDLEKPLIHNFVYRINAVLPSDIVVHEAEESSPEFHARFDAVSRTYEYVIIHNKNPFKADTAWYYQPIPDLYKLNEISALLLGEKSFKCFCKGVPQFGNYICKVTEAHWEKRDNEELVFTITANRFLRNMVRSIVGTLLEAGYGRLSKEEFLAIIEHGNRSDAGASVPAHGLVLKEVRYP